MTRRTATAAPPPAPEKWSDPEITAGGERRAEVALRTDAGVGAQTLWFNTGTLCNIECANCYILSSPTNDALVYLSRAEVARYLDEIPARGWPTREIGITGGEPFMNPEIIGILEEALSRGYETLMLTNAMRPMMRARVQEGLLDLKARFGDKLTLRVSIDHYTAARHDAERGEGSFAITLEGMRWLAQHGFRMHAAARTMWGEQEDANRDGFRRLFRDNGFAIDADSPVELVLFPEMDERAEVPEITESCWGILGKSPSDVMCSSARMVVKRRGAERPAVLACTLLAYDEAFELGETLADAEASVKLNHPHCAKFCVLGGAKCSA